MTPTPPLSYKLLPVQDPEPPPPRLALYPGYLRLGGGFYELVMDECLHAARGQWAYRLRPVERPPVSRPDELDEVAPGDLVHIRNVGLYRIVRAGFVAPEDRALHLIKQYAQALRRGDGGGWTIVALDAAIVSLWERPFPGLFPVTDEQGVSWTVKRCERCRRPHFGDYDHDDGPPTGCFACTPMPGGLLPAELRAAGRGLDAVINERGASVSAGYASPSARRWRRMTDPRFCSPGYDRRFVSQARRAGILAAVVATTGLGA